MAAEERKAGLVKARRYWKEQIENWQASGLSQSEFCRRHNLKCHHFYYWRKQFTRLLSPACKPDFVELPFGIRAAGLICESSRPIRLDVGRKNYRIELERDFDPVALRQLIHLLDQI
jgi:hypothetical protein